MCEIETKTKTESVLVHLIGKVCVQRECRTFILTEPKISSIIFKAARSVSTWLLSFLWSCHQLSPDAGNYWKCWKHVASCKVALIHPSELNTPFTSVKPRNLHDYSACQASAIKHKMQKGSDLKKKKKQCWRNEKQHMHEWGVPACSTCTESIKPGTEGIAYLTDSCRAKVAEHRARKKKKRI